MIRKTAVSGFDFLCPQGIWGFCDLTITAADGCTFVLISENRHNPGMSVTNAAEIIAMEVWEALLDYRDPHTITFFETYNGVEIDVVAFAELPKLVYAAGKPAPTAVQGAFRGPSLRRVAAGEFVTPI